jgi:hypothetical protein
MAANLNDNFNKNNAESVIESSFLQEKTQKTLSTGDLGSNANIQSIAVESLNPNFMMRNNCFIRKGVPESHRRVADNLMIIKKVFGQTVVQPQLSAEEKELLARYDFNLLELSTAKQIQDELGFLKKWSYSRNRELQESADLIIQIRAKELKYLIATRYVTVKKNYDGYKILDKYFDEISKYFS